jgi:hypothetical protein
MAVCDGDESSTASVDGSHDDDDDDDNEVVVDA